MENTLFFDFVSRHLPELKGNIAIQVENNKLDYGNLDKMIRKAIETFSSNYNKLLRP